MKVLHLNSEKTWRGGEQQMAYLANEIHHEGVKNFFAFPEKNERLIQFCKEHKYATKFLSFGGIQLLASIQLALWLRKNRIDLIHTHSAKAHTVAVWANIFGAKTKVVVSKRTDFKVKSPYKFHHKCVKAILCVSKKIEEITKEGLHHKKQDLVHTVHSGVDLDRFEKDQISLKDEYEIPENKILIGNCSAIADHKDYPTFVDTAAMLNEKYPEKYHFIIIGSGPDEEKIKKYVELKMLKNRFTFTGFLTDLDQKLKSLDVFLMTSKEEGLGTSLLDAMLCNIPIVSTNAGGIPEIVIHENTGLLAGIKQTKSLFDLVSRLTEDESLQKSLVSNAKKLVTTQYSKSQTATKTLAIYHKIIHED